jgi:hypothetical protein
MNIAQAAKAVMLHVKTKRSAFGKMGYKVLELGPWELEPKKFEWN